MRLLPISLFLAGFLLAEELPIRVISDARGWYFGTREVSRGDRLPATAELTGRRTSDLILDCGTSGWLAYNCSKAPCRVPACARTIEGVRVQRVDPNPPNGTATPSALGNMLLAFFLREPKAPETLGVRAGGNPNDAVIARNGDDVDFAPALNRVLEGRSCFRLARLPAEAAGTGAAFTLDWDRERTGSGRVRLAGLRPGAYTLQKGTPSTSDRCVFDEAAPAWVVIVPQSDWSRIDAEWKNYTPGLRQLEAGGATPDVVATVRRAVLSSLAETVESR